jgi:hypothetical protein
VEDFGEARLHSGRARIELDPLFLEAVTVDDRHPLKVFVELGGDCAGVYVSKGTTGFDVVELGGGLSSVPFDYRVVARRRGFEDSRLERCEAAVNDPWLYPDLRAERQRKAEAPDAILTQKSAGPASRAVVAAKAGVVR